jgi:hypothetical protein
MPDYIIPHKACSLAFGIQTALGVPAAVPTIALPIIEDTTGPDWKKNYSFFQYADGTYELRHYYSEGEWAEGGLSVPLIPGMLTAGDFADWLFGVDPAYAPYNQGYYGTLFRDLGNKVEAFSDVVVKSGSLAVARTGMAVLKLDVVGAALPVAAAPFAGTIYEAKPYTYGEATVRLALTDGAYGTPASTLEAEVYTSNHTLEFDKMVEAPADMITVRGAAGPLALPNNALPQWGGNFDRIFANSEIYDDFLAGREGQYELVLTRPAVAEATLTFPRIVYTEHAMNVPGSGIVRTGGIPFKALGSTDGATAAYSLVETAL